MSFQSYTAACPTCGQDCRWVAISHDYGYPVGTSLLRLDVQCRACDERDRQLVTT